MFCNHCGSPIQPNHRFCAKCGQTIAGSTAPYQETRFESHLHRLGTFWIIAGGLCLIPSFGLMTLGSFGGFGVCPTTTYHHVLFPPLMVGVGGGLLIIAAAGICVGWGLMHHEPWARTLAIILGALVLLKPPFGTALGIYTLWVLLSNNAGAIYEQAAPR